jgi:hypothetical protein
MILDEIEEMSSTLTKVYDNMEQVYAIYIREFPEKNAELDRLKQQLMGSNLDTVGEHEYTGPRHAATGGALVLVKQFDIREEMEKSSNEQSVEVEQNSESDPTSQKLSVRQLFRKINQLCHPDKCKRFSHEETARLRECFIEAGSAYANRDTDMLELIYIRICYIRNELHRLDQYLVNETKRKHKMLSVQLERVTFHPMYTVLQLHVHGMYPAAFEKFSVFLDGQIADLEKELGSQ